MPTPIFGTRLSEVTYKLRPSAYAVIRNETDQIALARSPLDCLLPGGGIEAGETPEETVQREGMEECGFILRPIELLGKATEFCYSQGEKEYFEKDSTFFSAEVVGFTASSEPDHELLWLTVEQALEALTHGSHIWAVRKLIDRS